MHNQEERDLEADDLGSVAHPTTWVVIETMPEHLRQRHTDARNWGRYPLNGAERRAVPRSEADEIIAGVPHEHAHIVGDVGAPGLELGVDIPFPSGTKFTVRRPGNAAWIEDIEQYSQALAEREFADRLAPGHIIVVTLPDGQHL